MSEKVDEKTGREAIDAVLKGTVEMQKAAGMVVPDVAAAEAFARRVALEQIKKHEESEERRYLKDPSPLPVGVSKARIDRGDVGEDTSVINRPVGEAIVGRGGGPMFFGKPNPNWTVTKPREDKLLRARLDFLAQFPDWLARIERAAMDGETVARARDHLSSHAELWSIVADHVIAVVEDSNRFFGDYRDPPKAVGPKIIVG